MTILYCIFYAFDSLSQDVSLEYIAKLVVAWLYYDKVKCLSETIAFRAKMFLLVKLAICLT